MNDTHEVIAPSGLARIIQCAGSLTLSLPFLDKPPTEETLEGDAAHWVAMRMAQGHVVAEDSKAPNGHIVDEEMIQGGEVYCEALESREGIPGVAEEKIPITRIHPTLCGGTPDFRQYSAHNYRLRITDYKYGHKYVEEYMNWQLIAYAAGVMEHLDLPEDLITLELVIVQPRYFAASAIRTWTIKATDLRSHINHAFYRVQEALEGTPETTTGPECTYCPARESCDTLRNAASSWVEFSGALGSTSHDAGDLGRELRLLQIAIERLKARESGLEEMAMSRLKAGEQVPFFKLGQTNPRQVWNVPGEEVLATLACLPNTTDRMLQKIKKPQQLCTPKQAIKAGVDASVISAYSFTPNGTLKIVPDSLANAAKVFSK